MRKIAITLVMILLFLQTGCWNAREINELAFVLSMGLDKTEDGFKVTAQIAKPETFSKTPSGSGPSRTEKPFWIVTSTGKTIFEAIRNMASIASRRIFWSHIKVIIISEEMAKSNTLEIFDFFSRNPELRLRTLVAITPGQAEKLFEVEPIMEKDPAFFLEKIIERRNLAGKAYDIMLKDFVEDYLDPDVGAVASRIVTDKSGSETVLKTSGAYVFDGSRIAGSLNEEETRGLLWIKNKINDSVMVVNCPYDGLPVTLEIRSSKSTIQSNLAGNTPVFTIKTNVTASLTEQACITDFNDPQILNGLKEALVSAIRKDMQSTIKTAGDLGVDFIGLSHTMHRQHRDEWHRISQKWPELIKDAEVKITVNVDIPHMSLAKPLEPLKTPDETEK